MYPKLLKVNVVDVLVTEGFASDDGDFVDVQVTAPGLVFSIERVDEDATAEEILERVVTRLRELDNAVIQHANDPVVFRVRYETISDVDYYTLPSREPTAEQLANPEPAPAPVAPVNEMSVTPEAVQFYSTASNTLSLLYARWQDEKAYENLSDYRKPLEPFAAKAGVEIICMTRRPFGCKFQVRGRVFTLIANARQVSYRRIK